MPSAATAPAAEADLPVQWLVHMAARAAVVMRGSGAATTGDPEADPDSPSLSLS